MGSPRSRDGLRHWQLYNSLSLAHTSLQRHTSHVRTVHKDLPPPRSLKRSCHRGQYSDLRSIQPEITFLVANHKFPSVFDPISWLPCPFSNLSQRIQRITFTSARAQGVSQSKRDKLKSLKCSIFDDKNSSISSSLVPSEGCQVFLDQAER